MLNSNERYIVRKGNRFLVGCPYDNEAAVRFSENKYDGYRMKDFNKARFLAKAVDGRVMKFNTITGTVEGGWR